MQPKVLGSRAYHHCDLRLCGGYAHQDKAFYESFFDIFFYNFLYFYVYKQYLVYSLLTNHPSKGAALPVFRYI